MGAKYIKCTHALYVLVFRWVCHACSCNENGNYSQPLAGKRVAAVLLLPYLNMSYVSEEGSMVTVHEHSDLHPVTLTILMSINVTDKDLTLCG